MHCLFIFVLFFFIGSNGNAPLNRLRNFSPHGYMTFTSPSYGSFQFEQTLGYLDGSGDIQLTEYYNGGNQDYMTIRSDEGAPFGYSPQFNLGRCFNVKYKVYLMNMKYNVYIYIYTVTTSWNKSCLSII